MLSPEIERRRTFAIISHPDAGKTTLTEKLLLFGGQIQVAGAVKNNKIKKTATSDWMEIEKQRGISVTTSVMEFDYDGYKVNILDTPGHQDFAEDTFRTLTAVDSAIIVVDSAKGVEAQTRKLMNVCRMRNTPVIVFVNKMDREGRDPFDLLDELEEELQISVRPLSWPINQGQRFKGVYNIYEGQLNLFTPDKQKVTENVTVDIHSEELEANVGEENAMKLREDLELVDGVYPAFNHDDYLAARVAPVFFGSALNNFGVKELLDCFVKIAPYPRPTKAEERMVNPDEQKFTGFIFKITANIDPNHRSCIAFCKVCSGKFVRNAPYLHEAVEQLLHTEVVERRPEEHGCNLGTAIFIHVKLRIHSIHEFQVFAQFVGIGLAHCLVELIAVDVHLHLLRHPLFVGGEEVELLFIYVIHALELHSLVDRP